MSKRKWMCVKEVRRVSSMIMYVRICIKRESWNVINVHVPAMEESEEERGKS